MGNNSNAYHGLKDRRQRPSTPYALLGAACVALGVLGCVLLFTGFFDEDEALLNIPPPAVVPKVYMHPASCLDAGTSLFRVHGSGQQEAIDEHQMLLRGQSSDGEVVVQHMCRCLSSFDAFLDSATSVEMAEQASSLTLDSIVDLGANVGMASLSFAFNHPEAEIISIEAGIHNYIGLRANVGRHKQIHTELAAIWDSDGFTKLNGSIVSQQAQSFSDWGTTVSGVHDVAEMQGMDMTDLVTALSMPTLMERFNLKTIDILKACDETPI
ncbi:MAG: hypothetical protein WDW38_010865 [Sanguina aurantia]